MPTLTYQPSRATTLKVKPNSLEARFVDNYSQRAADGINSNPKSWNLVYQDIDDTDADAIEAFFEARNGYEAFDWTPPGKSAGKYIVVEWSRRYTEATQLNTISATLKEEAVA